MLGDSRAVQWTNDDIGYLIDEAAKYLQNELKILQNRTSFSTVLNQAAYVMDASVMVPKEVEYYESGSRHKITGQSMDELRVHRIPLLGSRPYIYGLLDDEKTMELRPVPDASAPTTTINVVGGISATETSMTVTATTNFYSEGRVYIDTEVIGYTGKTSTTLTGLTRGLEGTTAATHANAATITARNVFIVGIRRYLDREMWRYYTTGTVTFTINSVTVTGSSTAFTNNVAAGDMIGQTANVTTTDPTVWYEIDTVDTATQVTLKKTFKEPTASAVKYISSSPNPFPNQYDGFFRNYVMVEALKKDKEYKAAAQLWGNVMLWFQAAKSGLHKPDVLLFPKGRHDRLGRPMGRMAVDGGARYGFM